MSMALERRTLIVSLAMPMALLLSPRTKTPSWVDGRPPFCGSALVNDTFFVVLQHARTNIVKGDLFMQFARMLHRRIPCRSSTAPVVCHFSVKTGIIINAKRNKGTRLFGDGSTYFVPRASNLFVHISYQDRFLLISMLSRLCSRAVQSRETIEFPPNSQL
jgi:hypothetical protein